MRAGILDDKNRIGALLLLAFSLAYLRQALIIPLDPAAADVVFTAKTLPIGLAAATILLSFVRIVAPTGPDAQACISDTIKGFRWRPMLLLTLLMAAYAMTFDWLGFLLGSTLFLLTGFLILGERRLFRSIAVSSGLVVLMWAMLTQVFDLYLDSGALFRAILDRLR